MRTLLVATSLGAVLASCGMSGRVADAATIENFNVPATASVLNMCNGETVDAVGRLHVQAAQTTDSNGGQQIEIHFNVAGMQGIGEETGIQYVFTLASDAEATLTGGATEMTQTVQLQVISQGSTQNFQGFVTVHLTFNADGTLTSSVSNVRFDCQP